MLQIGNYISLEIARRSRLSSCLLWTISLQKISQLKSSQYLLLFHLTIFSKSELAVLALNKRPVTTVLGETTE